MSADAEDQSNEIIALSSIYDDSVFASTTDEITGQICGHLRIFIDLPRPFFLIAEHSANSPEKSADCVESPTCNKYPIDYLPPYVLEFTLPTNYPSTSKPQFKLTCNWLNRKFSSKLCQKLDSLWQENLGFAVLFTWLNFLKEESLSYFKLTDILNVEIYSRPVKRGPRPKLTAFTKDGSENTSAQSVKDAMKNDVANSSSNTICPQIKSRRAKNYIKNRTSMARNWSVFDHRAYQEFNDALVPSLLDFDREQKRKTFLGSYVDCGVCFVPRVGSDCVVFEPCGHAFCNECIGSYFRVQISDGLVRNLNCPFEKCNSEATPKQVQRLVSPELYTRYDSLLLSSTLDQMSDVTMCPRQKCQAVCLLDTNETMATCPKCNFTFCTHCRMVYHGIEPCRLRQDERRELCHKYLTSDSEAKKLLEQRYGVRQLKTYVETMQSERWIESNSKNCPKCTTPIEKQDGCNKMTCWKCSTFFCWICMKQLDHDKPYDHYNTRGNGCFNQLFLGAEEEMFGFDEDDDDDEDELEDFEYFAQVV